MDKKKLKKKGKKVVVKKSDSLSVFNSKRRDAADSPDKLSREEVIRQDKIKLAKRYEKINLFDEAIKYFRQAGLEDEARRVDEKKVKLYSAKAKEFEELGKYDEAAELYDRIDMPERAAKLREKGGSRPYRTLDLDLAVSGEDNSEIFQEQPQHSKSLRWEMPNVDMEAIGKKSGDKPAIRHLTKPGRSGGDSQPADDMSIPLEASRDLVTEAEKEESKPGTGGSDKKKFSICPFCGEELNLPKQPRFCPYCKEAFE